MIDTGPGVGARPYPESLLHCTQRSPMAWALDLPICRAIIEAHEGGLWFIPNVPRGACFQFALPPNLPIAE